MDDHRKPLAPGHFIAGYSIVRAIGYGGFGIVYEAINPYTKDRAAIKQFYPSIFSWRQSTIIVEKEDDQRLVERILKRFEGEAAVQASFDHPNILKVKNFIRENNTGYLITEYIDGTTLLKHLKQYGNVFPDENVFRSMLEPISEAVGYVHEKLSLHRDISPDNILVDKSGRLVLVDFGAAKLDLRRDPSMSTIVQYKPDYAPIEQAEPSTERPEGCYTDIFALAGTMYRLLSGNPPERVIKRALAVRDPYVPIAKVAKTRCSEAVYDAIDRGLRMAPANRPQTIENFMQLLGWRGTSVRPLPPSITSPTQPKPAETAVTRRKQRNIVGHATVLVVVLGIVAGLIFFSGANNPVVVSRPSASSRPSPTSTQVIAASSSPTETSSPSLVFPPSASPLPTPTQVTVASPPSRETSAPSPAVSPVTSTPTPDPREREERLYREAKSCLGDTLSCNLGDCLKSYREDVGTGERYSALRDEYLRVMGSPRCHPSPTPTPVFTPTPIQTPTPVYTPTPDPKEREERLYREAKSCLGNTLSCNLGDCLRGYKDNVGTGERYSVLRDEYLRVVESPRCHPSTTPTSAFTPAPVQTPTPVYTPTPVTTPTPTYTPTPIRTPVATPTPTFIPSPFPTQAYQAPPTPTPAPTPAYTPPPSPASYTAYPNADMEGGDLAGPPQLYGAQSDCEAACNATTSPECVGYAYDKWIKACYLKGSLTQLRSDPESLFVVRSNFPRLRYQSGALDIEQAGFRLNDSNTPYSRTSATSRKACEESCRTDNACLGSQYEKGICSRYDRIDNATKDAKAQSGIKRQIAPERGAKR
jgi:serine/threonine protein kinase